jgi:SAM-dependent methyltransferase
MTRNKHHWYDGWFYDTIIAPNQDKLFDQIKNLVESDSKILDIGCGTGRLEFTLSDKCKSVLGIDLSKKNIGRANYRLNRKPDSKITFRHTDVNELNKEGNRHFDTAILTYVIHEVSKEERISLLHDIGRVADKIIIGDYFVPRPGGFGANLTEAIEFIAGRDHYRSYKSYVADGGIYYLADKAGLRIINEISDDPFLNHIVILAK